jgi:hypothetical protein
LTPAGLCWSGYSRQDKPVPGAGADIGTAPGVETAPGVDAYMETSRPG